MEQLYWHTEKRKVLDLVPWEKNPRTIKPEMRKKLEESLLKYGLVEIPAINLDNQILAGHQRMKAMIWLGRGDDEIDVRVPNRLLTQEEAKTYNVTSNKVTGEFDMQALIEELEKQNLLDIGFTENELKRAEFEAGNEISRSLVQDYIIPPFSIFDAKQGYWQERKKKWTEQIGDSGVGRSDDLINNLKNLAARSGMKKISGTSIFDPVLAEVLYTWYVPRGGLVIDPFAGGNVRGAIAGLMGNMYIGTDLSTEQVKANQAADEKVNSGAVWINDNGLNLNQHVKPETADFLMTCPPYYDLEVYTDNPEDISNVGTYEEFRKVYAEILKRTFPLLKPGAFATVVVGNIRNEQGTYNDLVGDTVRAMEDAGYKYYNEIILATPIANAALRARRIFEGGKKVVKIHQNVLTFWKEDKEIEIKGIVKELLEAGVTATAHQNVLMFKKPPVK